MFTGVPKLDPGRSYPALDESGKCAGCAELQEVVATYVARWMGS